MQIGHPTDVKHVAHIGRDGPSVDSPSWMQEFKSPAGSQSAPLGAPTDSQGNPEIKWVSEDSSRRGRRTKNSPARDLPELPKSSRRHSSTDNSSTTESSSTKSRQSRRHQSTDSSETIKTTGVPLEANLEPESPSRHLPDIPKKSRRKKSKESNSGGSSRSRRSKGTTSCTYTSQLSDPGPEIGTIVRSNSDETRGSREGK
ncbi:unnamed protein product [Ilex paraguariensis]|uniref:CRIB domain-containing protein n=1 Tax=Ilex paraguariensis TaxID=185542 RepID=A0ABC8TYC2_9AQUA